MIDNTSVIYLELPNGEKLISYHRHDYRSRQIGEDYYSIDGGQDGYSRVCGPSYKPTLLEKILAFLKIRKINTMPYMKTCDISECFSQIREELEWGSQYDKEGSWLGKTVYRKLKDLETSHIEILLDEYVTGFTKVAMLEELEFRKKLDKYIQQN